MREEAGSTVHMAGVIILVCVALGFVVWQIFRCEEQWRGTRKQQKKKNEGGPINK